MLTGADHIGRLKILPLLIKKFKLTKDAKYIRQAYQICNDHRVKIREFKRLLNKKVEHLKKVKKKKMVEHNQVPFPGLKGI